jgi:stringent starvation protein B
LFIPINNIISIYARENGHGMAFEVAKALVRPSAEEPSLDSTEAPAQQAVAERPNFSIVSTDAEGGEDTPPDEPPSSPAPARPKLTRIK